MPSMLLAWGWMTLLLAGTKCDSCCLSGSDMNTSAIREWPSLNKYSSHCYGQQPRTKIVRVFKITATDTAYFTILNYIMLWLANEIWMMFWSQHNTISHKLIWNKGPASSCPSSALCQLLQGVAVDKEPRLEMSCTHWIGSCSIAHEFHVVSNG